MVFQIAAFTTVPLVLQSEDDIRQFLIFWNLVSASGLLIVFISFFILFYICFICLLFPSFTNTDRSNADKLEVLDPSTPRVSLLRTKHDRAFTSKFFCRSYCYLCCVGCIYLVICLYLYIYIYTWIWTSIMNTNIFWKMKIVRRTDSVPRQLNSFCSAPASSLCFICSTNNELEKFNFHQCMHMHPSSFHLPSSLHFASPLFFQFFSPLHSACSNIYL